MHEYTLWQGVLEFLKDMGYDHQKTVGFDEFFAPHAYSHMWPESRNPLRLIDPTRPDRDIVLRLTGEKSWRILRNEAQEQFFNSNNAATKRHITCEYECISRDNY